MIGQAFDAKTFGLKPKATVQQTGKLGFNSDAIIKLGIDDTKAVLLAPDLQDKTVFYMALKDPKECDTAFAVRKSGAYFYINTKQLFDALEMDYAHQTIIYDIVRFEKYDEHIGGECYKMIGRIKPRLAEEPLEEINE